MEIPTVSDRYDAATVAGYYASGVWRQDTFSTLLADRAAERSDTTFVTDGASSLTYGQVHQASVAVALGLRDRGVRIGDRVAVQLPNWAEFVVVAAAVAHLGAIMVPIMPIYRRQEVGHVLD